MFKTLVTKVLGTRFERELKRIQPVVDAILEHETRLKGLSDTGDPGADGGLLRARGGARGTLTAEVERLKQVKHDCPDADQSVALDGKLREAESGGRRPRPL
jgi:preprotein translocase subunit SecA